MGKLKGVIDMDAAVTEIVEASYLAAIHSNRTLKPNEVYDILGKHGLSLIDDRLIEFLDDMPIGLEDMIEDDEDE